MGSVVDGPKLTGLGQLSLILSPVYEQCYGTTPPGRCYKQYQACKFNGLGMYAMHGALKYYAALKG